MSDETTHAASTTEPAAPTRRRIVICRGVHCNQSRRADKILQQVEPLITIILQPGQDLEDPLSGQIDDVLVARDHLVTQNRLSELLLECIHARMRRNVIRTLRTGDLTAFGRARSGVQIF